MLTVGGLRSERGAEVSRGYSTDRFFLREGRTESLSQGIFFFTGVQAMMNPAERQNGQMSLAELDEWQVDGSVYSGADVNVTATRRTGEWHAECERERTLTEDLMGSIADLSNLSRACQRVISNGGRGGVDGMEVEELREWFSVNYAMLQSQLLGGRYVPQSVRGVKIPKPKGGYRQLGIPTVVDRLVQQAILQVLSPRYEAIFSERSYGFRRGRSAHQALHQAAEYVKVGKRYVVDIDLAKFFDEVNHSRLLWVLSTRIGDKRVLKLIHRFLQSGLLEGGLVNQRIKGTPQGGPLSPLLSNIVLDELDKELERRGHSFVRYADDVIVLVGSEQSAKRVQASLTEYIEKRLKLRVNRDKSRIVCCWALNFLGHGLDIFGHLMLSQASEKRLKAKLKDMTMRNRGRSFEQILQEVNRSLSGWLNYFRYARMKGKLKALESWLKHRLRSYRIKQCKRAIGIARWLQYLGVPRDRSWTTATSRRGWWRKAASPAAHEGMNNDWFRRQGLIQVVDSYTRLHA
jgi:RNA-directed DNA polymerase